MGSDPPRSTSRNPWVIGLASACGVAVVYALVAPLLAKPYIDGWKQACMSNLKQLGQATGIYTQDSDGRLPDASQWQTDLQAYVHSVDEMRCPKYKAFGYAFNRKLSQAPLASLEHPENLPLIYDSSNLVANANDNFASLPTPPRHEGKNIMVYANGRYHTLPRGDQL